MPIDRKAKLPKYRPVNLATDNKLNNMKLTQSLANRLVATLALSVAVLLSANLLAQTQAGRTVKADRLLNVVALPLVNL